RGPAPARPRWDPPRRRRARGGPRSQAARVRPAGHPPPPEPPRAHRALRARRRRLRQARPPRPAPRRRPGRPRCRRAGDGAHPRVRPGAPPGRRALRGAAAAGLARLLPRPGHGRAAARRAHQPPRPALPGGDPRSAARPGRRLRHRGRRGAARPRAGRGGGRRGRRARRRPGARRRPARRGPDPRPAHRGLRDRGRGGPRPGHRAPAHPAGRPAHHQAQEGVSMIGRRIGFAIGAAVTALVLAACGTTEAPADEPASPAEGGGAQITVTDARGKQITFDRPATRAVGLEWALVEYLVTLGVMPVGVADVPGYTAWVQGAPLAEGVADVGVRGEPSVEAIAALRPDLVLATPNVNEGALTQLEAVAPVVVVRPADAADPIGQMRRN